MCVYCVGPQCKFLNLIFSITVIMDEQVGGGGFDCEANTWKSFSVSSGCRYSIGVSFNEAGNEALRGLLQVFSKTQLGRRLNAVRAVTVMSQAQQRLEDE